MRRKPRTEPGDRCPESRTSTDGYVPAARPDPASPGEAGAGLAEFALVLPVLLMILFGIIEFGLAFSRAQAIEAAAREGGRLASLSSTDAAEVESRVDAALGTAAFEGPPQVSIVPASGCLDREGQSVTVIVAAPHRITIPFVTDQEMTLTGQAVFRCEA